jgi:MoaA/NifB/PqqE/SkfB family radical SAM enzyme
MANNFCRFLSNGYRIKSDGVGLVYQPCCWYSKEINLLNNPNFDQEKQLITDISGWVPECASCKQIEDSGAYGNRSPRLRSFEEIPDESIPDNVPAWMELTIDTTCNAACIMCGPWHSTTWRKQEVKFKIKTKDDLLDLVDPLHWLEVIKNKFPMQYVKSVSFLGGEPFESPVPLEFLKLLKTTHGSLHDVAVHFQTNGSIKPNDELMGLAAECARIKFNLSIDAVGERFEYHRYPLRWYRIESTIKHVRNLNLGNLKFVCLATLTPLNVLYYDELEDWTKETFDTAELISLKPNKSIGKIDLRHTPILLRHEVYKKFGEDHTVSKLFTGLGSMKTQSCVAYLDQLDQYRKTDWRKTFPEISDYLK